jgi:hypothetical protein
MDFGVFGSSDRMNERDDRESHGLLFIPFGVRDQERLRDTRLLFCVTKIITGSVRDHRNRRKIPEANE